MWRWFVFILGAGLLGQGLDAKAAGEPPAVAPVLGSSQAVSRARVLKIQAPNATIAFTPQPGLVQDMVRRGLLGLTGQTNLASAWRSLVATQETLGLKVYSAPGAISGTRPAVVEAVVQGLLEAGFAPGKLVIWDKHLADLRQAGFGALESRYGVRLAGSAEAGYDEKAFYETALLGQLVWNDVEFGQEGKGIGRRSFVSKLVTRQITKIINIPPLLNHNQAGVTGNLYSLAFGSVDNLHRFAANPARLGEVIPEIVALPELGDRVVLNLTDALICQYEGESRSLLHYTTPLNQLWFSRDPVALDRLACHELERQRRLHHSPAIPIPWDLFNNAGLLQLGASEDRLIQIEWIP